MHKLAMRLGLFAKVVKALSIDEDDECQIRIVARNAGFFSWILSVLGISPTYTLLVFADRIESIEASLSGKIKTVVPMRSLDTYTSGFIKPVFLLVVSIAVFLFSLIAGFVDAPVGLTIGLFALATWFFILYFLRRCLLLNFTTNGGRGIFVLFKRSVIEGVNMDEELADYIAHIVKRNYLNQVGS